MKTMYITRGLPGSSKSTIINKLVENEYNDDSYVTCSTDRLISPPPLYLWSKENQGLAHQLNIRLVEEAAKRSIEHIYVDNTHIRYSEIKPYLEFAIIYEYDVCLVYPNTPWANNVDECFRRNTHKVPLETIQRMHKNFETDESVTAKIQSQIDFHQSSIKVRSICV